jgi:hypothetical protein
VPEEALVVFGPEEIEITQLEVGPEVLLRRK